MTGVFIVAAKRTPFGAFNGSLAKLSATRLGVVATQACLHEAKIDPSLIDNCYFGNVLQTSSDAAYLARHVALESGLPIPTPALTINRLCGSGLETVRLGMHDILLGNSQMVLCGGTENMSAAPFQVSGTAVRTGVALGTNLQLTDSLWDGLTDAYCQTPMGQTAENLAQKYHIRRQDCDAYAVRSQQNWKRAHEQGSFQRELATVETKHRKGKTIVVDTDEHARPETTSVEQLAKLKPVFAKDGVVNAANASGICDGAGAILLASEEALNQHSHLTPLARVVATSVVGCEPTLMGIGPVPAIQSVLKQANVPLSSMDRIEINEAFAAQVLACVKALEIEDLEDSQVNTHGGAISLGHPLGASGSRILAHLAHAFAEQPEHKYHLASACIGGGQGMAVLLERA